MYGIGLAELLIIFIILVVTGIAVLPFWWIFRKAGFSGWLCLTQFVPILNVVMLFYLAFVEWPIHQELTRLKNAVGDKAV